MKLIPVSAVRELLRLDEIDRIDAAIEQCLHAATEQLAGLLRTSFDQVTTYDTFMLRTGLRFDAGELGGTRWHYRLALTRGLVTGTPTFLRAGTLAALAEATDGLGEEVGVLVNSDKGSILLDSATRLDGLFLRVSYTAGLAIAEGTLYDGVPEWLQQCALAYGATALLKSNPDLGGSNAKQASRDPKELMAQAKMIVEGHIRYFASTTRPLNF